MKTKGTVMSESDICKLFGSQITTTKHLGWKQLNKLIEAQDTKTASYYQQKIRELFGELLNNGRFYHYAEINGSRKEDTFHIWLSEKQYQALKEKYLEDV